MARAIVINIWCDICLNEDDMQVEAKEMPAVAIGAAKPIVLALCPVHEERYFAAFRDALNSYGTNSEQISRPPEQRKLGRPPAQPSEPGTLLATQATDIVCPMVDCPSGSRPMRNMSSLRGHMKTQHDTTIDAVMAQGDVTLYTADGTPLEWRGRAPRTPSTTRAECTECDAVYEYPDVAQPVTALGVHKAKAHGIAGSKSPKAKAARAAKAKASAA